MTRGPSNGSIATQARRPSIRDAHVLTPAVTDKLRSAGVKQITAYLPGYWDLVCDELCGQGHYTMQAKVEVIDNAEYIKRFETPKNLPHVAMADLK